MRPPSFGRLSPHNSSRCSPSSTPDSRSTAPSSSHSLRWLPRRHQGCTRWAAPTPRRLSPHRSLRLRSSLPSEVGEAQMVRWVCWAAGIVCILAAVGVGKVRTVATILFWAGIGLLGLGGGRERAVGGDLVNGESEFLAEEAQPVAEA